MTKHQKPKVSIGLPVYNGENFLKEALDSIINQTFQDFELIISNNCSTDKTAEICKSYADNDERITYLENAENTGACPNFCKVFEHATGEYFMWAAHDDIYAPTFVEQSVKVLDENPDVTLCFSKTKFIDETGKHIKDYDYTLRVESPNRKERFLDMIAGAHIVIEAFGLTRSDLLRTTPLLEGYVGTDRVLLGEMLLHGPFHIIPEFLFLHREHSHRSTIKFKELSSRTAWHDASTKKKIVLPFWRIYYQSLLSVFNSAVPISFLQRIGLSTEVLRAMKWNKEQLWNEVVAATKQIVFRTGPK